MRGRGEPIETETDGLAGGRPWLWTAILACLGLAGWLAWTRGGWLDEYWTVWHSDPALPFLQAYRTRWLHDTQHPPAFYALAWGLGHLVGPGLGARRLAADVLGLLLLVPPLWLSRRDGRVPAAVLFLLLVVLSGPYAVTYLAEHRSYALGLLAATALLIALREVHEAAIAGWPIGTARAGCLVGTAAVAGNLHYTLAMIQLILLGCFFLFHGLRGHRAAAALTVAAGVVVAGPLALALGAALHSHAPVVAIHVGVLAGLRTIAAMLVLGFAANLVLLIRAVPAAKRWDTRPGWRNDPRTTLLLILLATLTTAALAFAGLEVIARNMYPRLALGLLPPAGLVVAELAASRPLPVRWAALAAANAVAVAAATVAFPARDPRLDQFGPALAAAMHACPATRIVAVDPLALTAPDDPLRGMTGQAEAVTLGYRATAARWGVPVRLWPADGPPPAPDRHCPTLIWMEHGFMLPQGIDARTLAARVGIAVPAAGWIGDRRIRWHYLVQIDPRP